MSAGWSRIRGTASASMVRPPRPGRLHPADLLRLAVYGQRSRPMRVALSALGIAIGIAAMVAVVGISTSSRAVLQRQLDALGTNLLTAAPGRGFFGEQGVLPHEAVAMIGRLDGVLHVTAVGSLANARVYRSDRIPAVESGGIGTYAVHPDLLDTVGGRLAQGTWLSEATAAFPTVVLGWRAAQRLGIGSLHAGLQVWLGGRWFTVIGVLEPVTLVPRLDTGALVGWEAAHRTLGFDGSIALLYVRTDPRAVEAVARLLPRTAHPARPNEVDVSRPSDALAAEAAVDLAFTGLLLGITAVALLVGGIGVANTMVISVLERRAEIGLRRSLGATRGHVRVQFLGESALLAAMGGGGGVIVGVAVTAAYATLQRWPTVVPPWVVGGALLVTLAIGAAAGLYPALRAAALAPTEALAAA
jgi:putative ABC transport system permease protein